MVHLSKGQRIIYEGENIANVNDRECSLNTETWIVANIARKLFSKQTQLTKMATKTTSILMSKINLASQRAVQPNSPPTLSLTFNAFCSKAQVKMLFVSEWNHVCHCFCVAQGEKGQGDDAPRCQIASKGVETESRSEHDVKESPLWRRWKSCQGGQ